MPMEIRTTPAIINYQSTPAKINIEHPDLEVVGDITQPLLEMKSTQPKVLIDQTQPFNEAGLKTMSAFMGEISQYAKNMMHQSIGRIVSQGNQLADIHKGGDPIVDQAIYNAYDQFIYDYNIESIPKSKPDIQVVEGTIDMKVTGGENTKRYITKPLEISYQPWKLDFYMKQMNSISMRYVENQVDLKV